MVTAGLHRGVGNKQSRWAGGFFETAHLVEDALDVEGEHSDVLCGGAFIEASSGGGVKGWGLGPLSSSSSC